MQRLHELLKQDQEPFHLKNFIADRRRSHLKSPFLDFPAKTPSNNAAVFHIPARIATLLFDAAVRVQKPKPASKRIGFGSFLRRLSMRRKRREIGPPATRRCRKKSANGDWSKTSCSSSPFRFSLQQCLDSSLSVASPRQKKESYGVESPKEINRQKDEEKEHCSPVSVLDPMFDDDDEEEEREVRAMDEDYDKCSYASVQRAKHQLLQKLQQFERLAGLDPIKLENHMLEQCYNEDEDVLGNGEEVTNETIFREIVNHLGIGKIPWYMKKLVFDLIEEENKYEEHHVIVQRVCKQLYSWKVVELNTIDMMVETDFKSEGWNRCDEETVEGMVMDIEVAIFVHLVEELAQ